MAGPGGVEVTGVLLAEGVVTAAVLLGIAKGEDDDDDDDDDDEKR